MRSSLPLAANANSALLAAKGFDEGSVVGQYGRQPTMPQQQQQQPIQMQPLMGTARPPSTTPFQAPIQPPTQPPPPLYGYGTYNAAANTNTPGSQARALSPAPGAPGMYSPPPQVPMRSGPGGPVPAYGGPDPRPPSGASYNAPPVENPPPPLPRPGNYQAGGYMASPQAMEAPPRVPGRPYAPAPGNYANNSATGDVV